MRKRTLLNTAIYIGTSFFIFQGCTESKTFNSVRISSIQSDTLVSLKDGDNASPKCKISIDYMFLETNSENDSITNGINSTLQRITFGTNYENLSPYESVKQAICKYSTDYRKDLIKYYEADIYNGMKPEDIPSWYNYEYEISSELKLNSDSIWNFSVTNFQNTGGAHPNTYIKWCNILASSGVELTKDMVFKKEKEKDIISLIMKHLIEVVNDRLETDTITSIEGLKENGALLDVDLYIPDNFMLKEDKVSFLYNRYDIAPYSMGEFVIDVPYAEIETMLKIKEQ